MSQVLDVIYRLILNWTHHFRLELAVLLLCSIVTSLWRHLVTDPNPNLISFQARLLSVSDQWEIPTEEPESLEITEDENENETRQRRDEQTDSRPNRVQQSNYLLASMVITAETREDEKCPLWTRGLQRSFKVINTLFIQINIRWLAKQATVFSEWMMIKVALLYLLYNQIILISWPT